MKPAGSTFASFFSGGFECSSHRRGDRRRLDLIRSTRHDVHALRDYLALRQLGLHTCRDGLRWHRIEYWAGQYNWDSFLPQLRAAQQAGVQPIWDLCHYGWPDHLDIWSPRFVDSFAAFAAAVARLVRDESEEPPLYCPINEISFWAWAGGEVAYFNPWARRQGAELKYQLVRAAVAAIAAIRQVDPRARIVQAEPVIHIVPDHPRQARAARQARQAQFEAWDMVGGIAQPMLGGNPTCLDILGVNFYPYNQWRLRGGTIFRGDPAYRPFRDLLCEVYQRYRRPLFVAETGAEGEERVPWLRYICDEVAAALQMGVPVEGICLYPVTDYPGWDNSRHCPTGVLGMAAPDGGRPVFEPLAAELHRQQRRFAGLGAVLKSAV